MTLTPTKTRYSTIIFDLDGTIADTLSLIYDAFNAAFLPETGRRLEPDEIRAMFGPPDNYILRSRLPAEAAEAAIERYIEVYERDHDRHVTLFDGLRPLLEAVKAQGVSLAVVTGKSRVTALYTLKALGVGDLFEVVYAGDDVERQKPDPEAVHAVLEQLGRGPDRRAVIVGDSAADVQAGKAAGIDTIGVLWGSPDHHELRAAEPDRICATVEELGEALGLPAHGMQDEAASAPAEGTN